MSKTFKTSRAVRRGAALVKEWFVIARKPYKGHIDWGRTTPSSIGRWLRVMEARKREHERLHPAERPHLRHELLRGLDEVGESGQARLLSEWPQLRGPTDAERAGNTSRRNLARLEKKHPLFAAMDALDEVAKIPTPESTLQSLRSHWERGREIRMSQVDPRTLSRSADPDAVSDDRMSLNQLRVWGRVSLGWSGAPDAANRDVDGPHAMLAREVLLANSRDEAHLREVLGGIFFSCYAHGIEGNCIGAPALCALRRVATEVTGSNDWLGQWIERGRARRIERLAEQEAKRAEQAAKWSPTFLQREQQLVIPLGISL